MHGLPGALIKIVLRTDGFIAAWLSYRLPNGLFAVLEKAIRTPKLGHRSESPHYFFKSPKYETSRCCKHTTLLFLLVQLLWGVKTARGYALLIGAGSMFKITKLISDIKNPSAPFLKCERGRVALIIAKVSISRKVYPFTEGAVAKIRCSHRGYAPAYPYPRSRRLPRRKNLHASSRAALATPREKIKERK